MCCTTSEINLSKWNFILDVLTLTLITYLFVLGPCQESRTAGQCTTHCRQGDCWITGSSCPRQNGLDTMLFLYIFLQILGFLYLSLSCTNLSFTFFGQFQARIEELQERMEKLKKELKKQRDKESSLLEEKDRLKQVQSY